MTDENVDEAKGRLDEAAGSLLDSLKQEGREDQATASVKEAVDKVADAAKGPLDR